MLLVTIALAVAARIQLFALIPAALTALLVAPMLERGRDRTPANALERAVREHWAIVGVAGAGLVGAAAAALVGRDVLALAGRYANVGHSGLPNVGHFLNLLIRHVTGIDLAVGVVPFIGSLVAAYVFIRSSRSRDAVAYAVVAACVTGWLLIEVAFDAALFDGPHGGAPIHERFLIYVKPLFLVALVAACRAHSTNASLRVYLAAGVIAALLPAVIPFDDVINQTTIFESIGMHPFARNAHGELAAIPHASIVAISAAATAALLYVQVRERLRSIVVLVLIPFVVTTSLSLSRIEATSRFARSLLPTHVDWVDRANPVGDVVIVTGGRDTTPELETAYSNLSVSRLFYLCRHALGREFGEQQVTIDRSGRLRGRAGLEARYTVAPESLHLSGSVLARNRSGHEVLVAPEDRQVRMPPARRGPVLKQCESS